MSLIRKLKSIIFPRRMPIFSVSRLPHASQAIKICEQNLVRIKQERLQRQNDEYEKLMRYITKRVNECVYNQIILTVPSQLTERVGNALALKGYMFEPIESRSKEPMYRISWKQKV